MDKATAKYLSRYAEHETRQINGLAGKSYAHSILIPAYLENTDFLVRLDKKQPQSSAKFLLVLVSNHPDNLSIAAQQKALSCHLGIEDYLGESIWQSGHLSLHERSDYDVLLVSRVAGMALPSQQAVGLARKMGADIQLRLIKDGIIESPWMMGSDADAHLPDDYFTASANQQAVALAYPFKHRCADSALGRATYLYEKSINHYSQQLRKAGSQYGFHTLGSCIAVHADAYVAARGYPKRAAAEDFYLLNKLAKLGCIKRLKSKPIIIEARNSKRVPFGTGPAVEKLLQSDNLSAVKLF